jgi:hypothetical protein
VLVEVAPGRQAAASVAPDATGRAERVRRYKEKRHARLFSKRIRYEVRRINAVRRPRLKVGTPMIRHRCAFSISQLVAALLILPVI